MQPSRIMEIGPETATRLLERNENNRPISDRIVKQYAQDMRDGKWKETGNPINIDVSGNLLNGQHRLWAIIESGATIRFHVIYETDADAFATFDTGRTRDLTQLIGIKRPDHPDKAAASGAARLIKMWEEADPHNGFNTAVIPTRSVMVEFTDLLLDDPAFEWASRVAYHIHTLKAGRTWYAAALYIIGRAQGDNPRIEVQNKVAMFHKGVAKGIGLDEGDPRLALRNYVISRGSPNGSTEQRIYMALTVRAWNAWLAGRTVKNLAWREDSVFPTADKA